MSGVDYIVSERRSLAILSEVNSLLPPLERDIRGRVKIASYLEKMNGKEIDGYTFRLVKFDCEAQPERGIAYVKTVGSEKFMYVDAELWDEAKLGDPHAIYVLLHELGHVVLHAGKEKSFSSVGINISKYPNERRAEWQAHEFARQCALPYSLEVSSSTLDEICRKTGLEISFSREIREGSRCIFPVKYQGEGCVVCGNFTLIRSGIQLACDTCGALAE